MKTNNVVSLRFGKLEIRAFESPNGGVEWICLNDVCRALSRDEMAQNGQAVKLCKTSHRLPFCKEGRNRWGIKPYDIHPLLRVVASENGMVAKVCDELQSWVNGLPIAMGDQSPSMVTIQTPSNEPVIFSYQDKFPITFKNQDGRTMINANQMALSFGKRPVEWLRLSSTSQFRVALASSGESGPMELQIATIKGKNGSTWIEESLAMEFARWLSPEFSIWCNQRIKELLTTGVVTTRQRSSDSVDFPVPTNFAEALLLAAEQQK